MKPEKFKKICTKYFTDHTFTIEDTSIINIDDNNRTKTISIFFDGNGILRYCCSDDDKEKSFILLADKFRYEEKCNKILPCGNDGSFIVTWNAYTKLYNVGHDKLIKIILKLIEKIKIAKIEYKKQLIEKDFENEG